MMKKIFALVLLLVLGKMSYAQYPLQQNLGSDSTIVISKGALQSRLIPIVIADTNAANAQRIKGYPGAQLYTSTGDFYVRNSNATKWVLVSSGSSGPLNIYNSDGTLTGNRTLSGANYSLTFNQLSKLLFNADSTTINTDQATISNNGVSTLNVKGATGRIFLMDTTAPADEKIYELKSSNGEFYISILNDAQTANDSAFLITSASRVGINTTSTDSTLKVGGGVNILGGLRVGNLPTSPGTKALRINAQGQLSIADTSIAVGTVTSVATNNGSGITGGTITSSGTLAIDTTNVIATKVSVSGGLAGKLNISDTSNMLKDYFNSTGYGLTRSTQTILTDSATLSAYYLRRKDSLTATNPLGYVTKKILSDTAAAIRSADAGGTVTSVATNNGTGITGGTITTSGTLAIDTLLVSTRAWRQKGIDSVQGNLTAGLATKLNISDTASMLSPYLRSNSAAATYVPLTRTITINGTSQDLSVNRTYNVGTVTSVGLTMPAAFSVANTPVIGSGTLAVTATGVSSQYIRGDGQLATLPTTGGGGSSVSYYLNGSINQGTFGGNTYYQMNKTPIIGTGTDFTISSNGYIASFITDAGDPALLNIPAGNWDFEVYFQSSSSSGTPSFYVELYKYDGTTFTLIASSSANPKFITGGTTVDAYYTPLAVPSTSLTITDRLAIRVYVNNSGNTITLHTEDNNLCQVITTFSTGINALNGLTTQVQYFATGTSGTDFGISSVTNTHTFNLPIASGSNTGKLSNTDWTTFNNKVGGSGTTNYVSKFTGAGTIGNSQIQDDGTLIGVGGSTYANTKVAITGIGATSLTDGLNVLNSGGVSVLQVRDDGVVGINAQGTPDSSLTVRLGTHLKRGVRMSALPQAPGTKALRIDASGTISYADTLIDAGGTVTSVATNNGTGITGGTITTTGTLAIDTLLISTRAWRQKGVDSLQANINLKLNISDTASMLANYITGPQNQSGYMARFNGGGTIDTSRIFQNNGLIGINTTLPFYSLDVLGTGRVTSNTYLATSSGVVGIGTTSADSLLTVEQGAWVKRGLRLSGLPSGVGIKSLRVDANGTVSLADTLANGISGSGTTNYIPKFTSSSAIGNSLLFETGNLIGFGTTSPQNYGNRTFTISASNTTGVSALVLTNSDNTRRGHLYADGTNNLITIGSATSTPLQFVIADSERMRLDASGNLGLGTSTPSGQFHTYTSGDKQLLVTYPSTFATRLTIGNAAFYIQNDASPETFTFVNTTGSGIFDWKSGASATQRMRLDGNGNLGLGVTPSAWGSAAKGFQIGSYGSISGFTNELDISSNSYWNAGYKYINTNPATLYTQYNGQHQWFTAPSGTAGTTISFTQAMTLDASGNLGVGVTSMNNKLDVAGNINSNLSANNSINLIRGTFFSASSSASLGKIRFGGGEAGQMRAYMEVAQVWDGTYTDTDLSFFTTDGGVAGDTRMIIKGTGNVGIGTTSPYAILDLGASGVANNMILRNTTSAFNLGYIGNAGGRVDIGFSNSNSSLVALPYLSVTSGGSVGIGTTSPTAKLEVAGQLLVSYANPDVDGIKLNATTGTNAASIMITNTGGNFYIGRDKSDGSRITGTAYANAVWAENSYPLIFGVNNGERMRITSVGEVLVGSTTSTGMVTNQLQLGNTSSGGSGIQFLSSTTGTGGLYFGDGTTGGDRYRGYIEYVHSVDAFIFSTATTERMRITSGGELLINTTSDAGDYKLQVNGNGYFTGSVTTNGNFILPASGVLTAQSSGATIYIHAGATYPGGTIESVGGTAGSNAGVLIFRTGTGTGLQSEWMRITSGGKVLVNTTTDAGAYPLQINKDVYVQNAGYGYAFAGSSAAQVYKLYGSSAANLIYFNNNIAGDIASINGTTGAYTALSDSTKKKDFEASTLGLNAVLDLKPTLYRMKSESSSAPKHLGFLAQEVKNVVPQAYVQDDKMIGLDYSAIIPVLTKAIQELNAKLEALKSELETLKNK